MQEESNVRRGERFAQHGRHHEEVVVMHPDSIIWFEDLDYFIGEELVRLDICVPMACLITTIRRRPKNIVKQGP